MTGDYRSYRVARIAFPLFLCAYVSVAMWRERIPGQGEIFPFASWSLFSLVPNECHTYSIRVIELNGRKLSSPLWFEESTTLFRAAGNHAAQVVIDRLGKAVAAHDEPLAASIRRRLEMQYLNEPRQLRYELVARVHDPLERLRTGRFKSLRVLSTFERASDDPATQHDPFAPFSISTAPSPVDGLGVGAPAR